MVDKSKLENIKSKAEAEIKNPENKTIFKGIKFMFMLIGALVFIMILIFLFSQELTGRNLKGWAKDLTQNPEQDRKINQLYNTIDQLESKINSVEVTASTPMEPFDSEKIKETINSELSTMGQSLLKTQQLSRHFGLIVYLFQRIETAFYQGHPFNNLFLELAKVLPEKIQSHPVMARLGQISIAGVPTIFEIKTNLRNVNKINGESVSFFKKPLSYLKSLITIRRSEKDPELEKIINALDKQNLNQAVEIIRLSTRSYEPAVQDLYHRIEALQNLQDLNRIVLAYLSGKDL